MNACLNIHLLCQCFRVVVWLAHGTLWKPKSFSVNYMWHSDLRDLETVHGNRKVSIKFAWPMHIPQVFVQLYGECCHHFTASGKSSAIWICGSCSELVTIQVKRTEIRIRPFVSIVMSHLLLAPQHMTIDLFSSVLHSYWSLLNYDECLLSHEVKLGQMGPRSFQYICHI